MSLPSETKIDSIKTMEHCLVCYGIIHNTLNVVQPSAWYLTSCLGGMYHSP